MRVSLAPHAHAPRPSKTLGQVTRHQLAFVSLIYVSQIVCDLCVPYCLVRAYLAPRPSPPHHSSQALVASCERQSDGEQPLDLKHRSCPLPVLACMGGRRGTLYGSMMHESLKDDAMHDTG